MVVISIFTTLMISTNPTFALANNLFLNNLLQSGLINWGGIVITQYFVRIIDKIMPEVGIIIDLIKNNMQFNWIAVFQASAEFLINNKLLIINNYLSFVCF